MAIQNRQKETASNKKRTFYLFFFKKSKKEKKCRCHGARILVYQGIYNEKE